MGKKAAMPYNKIDGVLELMEFYELFDRWSDGFLRQIYTLYPS